MEASTEDPQAKKSGVNRYAAIMVFRRLWAPFAINGLLWAILPIFLPQLGPLSIAVIALIVFTILLGQLLSVLFPRRPNLLALFIRAANCRTLEATYVNVHAPNNLLGEIERAGLIDAFEQDMPAFARWFGFSLSKQVNVFLFSNSTQIGRFCRATHAFAMVELDSVFVPLGEHCRMFFRHEVAHLFAAQLGPARPAFKVEGLCVFFEWDGEAPKLDQVAFKLLGTVRLAKFLSASFFFNSKNRDACYIIAGSFTHWLINRFGWKSYCSFYRAAGRWNFQRAFEQSFGMPLSQAETLWREEIALRGY